MSAEIKKEIQLEVPAGLTIANLKLDPFWDPLRKDPRFINLIAEPQPK